MGFTNPFTGIERRRMTDAELAQAIRIDMAAELDAINLYQAHLESTDNPVAKQIIQHIMEEEKEHLTEFEQLLYLLDPKQAEIAAHAGEELTEAGVGEAPVAIEPVLAAEPPSSLTVGSLK